MGWVKGSGEAAEAFHEGVGWGVEVFVWDAEDLGVADGSEVVPVALLDDAGEGDAVGGAAPGEDEGVGVGGGYIFGGGVGAGVAEELAARGFDEFRYPVLGADEGLAPLFAVDGGVREGLGSFAGYGEVRLEVGDEALGCFGCAGEGGEEADVGEDVGEGVWGEREDGEAGFEDGGEGLHAVGDGGNDEGGVAGFDFGGVGRPGVVEDGEVEAG